MKYRFVKPNEKKMKKTFKAIALAAALALPMATSAAATTIVDAAVGTKNLSTLVAAVKRLIW